MKPTLEMIKDERGGVEMTYTTSGVSNALLTLPVLQKI